MARSSNRTVAVIGAGSSGQAIAGFLGLSGYRVRLWNRDNREEIDNWLKPIAECGGLTVRGLVEGFAPIHMVTTDIGEAVAGADFILLNTTTDAYKSIGEQLAAHVLSSQYVILMGAGTLGGLDLWRGLTAAGFMDHLSVAETSTTVFASRSVAPATVHISGRKDNVEIASLPSGDEKEFVTLLPEFSFKAGGDVLASGFNNMGTALHMVPMLLNAGRIEAQNSSFLYYAEGITPSVAAVIQQLDDERIAIARAFGYEPTTLSDYLTESVGAPAGTLYESIHGCAMYSKIPAPGTLDHRFLWEDTPSGGVPLLALAEVADIPVPTCSALVTIASAVLGRNFREVGRTARHLGLEEFTVSKMRKLVQDTEVFSQWKRHNSTVAIQA